MGVALYRWRVFVNGKIPSFDSWMMIWGPFYGKLHKLDVSGSTVPPKISIVLSRFSRLFWTVFVFGGTAGTVLERHGRNRKRRVDCRWGHAFPMPLTR